MAQIDSLEFLVVEDHDPMRAILEKTLRAAGATKLRAAEDGRQALDLLEERAADVIVTDHNMPGMDGLDFLKALKADAKLKAARVVMITGYAEVVGPAHDAGADAVLMKPVSPGDLLAAIEAALSKG